MRTAAAGGIPVPTVHAFDLWQGHPAMLLSWCEGRTVLAEAQARPWRAYGLGLMSGRTLARIHRLTAPAQSWSWWQSVTIDEPLREYLAAISRDDALLHLDYHPLNLLTDGYQVTAVLVWTNARCGDPRADLARSITILRLDTGELPPAARLLARIFERGLHRGYGPVDAFAPFLAWAGAYMLDDLSARLTPQQRTRIVAWIERWTRRSSTR
jgi:aminoglycoside phosphotransferase (APT) family kinase protein